MQDWNDGLEAASEAWRRWCSALERTGLAALERTLSHDEIDLAEGVRYLSRLTRLALQGQMENNDSAHPYLSHGLSPTMKMWGDNPQGIYLSAPINGTDTFVVRGTRGSAVWVSSAQAMMRSSCASTTSLVACAATGST